MKSVVGRTAGLGVCCIAAGFLAGCGPKPESGQKPLRLAFVAGAATDFWTFAKRGCEKAEREMPGTKIEFRFTTGGTAVEQRTVLDDLLTRGVDGLAVTPLDPVNQKPMIDRVAAGVPVVITDSDIPESPRICYVGTDNVEAGRVAGGLVKEVLPQGGKIMLFVGKADAQNAKERIQGLRQVLEGSKIEIVDVRSDDIDRIRAKANVNDTLVKYPDISGLVGLWSYNAPMILDAVREAGKLGQVKIVAFDEESDTINGVKDGHIHATVVQQPFEFGYQAMKLLAQVARGDRSGIPADKKINIPVQVIRQADAVAFLKKTQALREGADL